MNLVEKQAHIEGEVYGTDKYVGFIKIWKSCPITGNSELIIDKHNTIMYTGADVLAMALAGVDNAKISHMYLGYSTTPPGSYSIDKANSVFLADATHGYLRIPLTFPATFLSNDSTRYQNNIAVFTVTLNNATGLLANGSQALTGSSQIYEAGLIAALNPNDTAFLHPNDQVFARISFTPVTYDPTFNLTVSWGVKFIS
jgi:hypothetical protein